MSFLRRWKFRSKFEDLNEDEEKNENHLATKRSAIVFSRDRAKMEQLEIKNFQTHMPKRLVGVTQQRNNEVQNRLKSFSVSFVPISFIRPVIFENLTDFEVYFYELIRHFECWNSKRKTRTFCLIHSTEQNIKCVCENFSIVVPIQMKSSFRSMKTCLLRIFLHFLLISVSLSPQFLPDTYFWKATRV